MIYCRCVGTFEDALTYGAAYEVLSEGELQFQVRGDNGRVRWFPAYCFSADEPPRLLRWTFGPGESLEQHAVEEAELDLSDGTRRWLWVATPDALRSLLERNPPGVPVSHTLLVPDLDPATVEAGLRHLERQGDLLESSRPVG